MYCEWANRVWDSHWVVVGQKLMYVEQSSHVHDVMYSHQDLMPANLFYWTTRNCDQAAVVRAPNLGHASMFIYNLFY